jgi:hypothetical protein
MIITRSQAAKPAADPTVTTGPAIAVTLVYRLTVPEIFWDLKTPKVNTKNKTNIVK